MVLIALGDLAHHQQRQTELSNQHQDADQIENIEVFAEFFRRQAMGQYEDDDQIGKLAEDRGEYVFERIKHGYRQSPSSFAVSVGPPDGPDSALAPWFCGSSRSQVDRIDEEQAIAGQQVDGNDPRVADAPPHDDKRRRQG